MNNVQKTGNTLTDVLTKFYCTLQDTPDHTLMHVKDVRERIQKILNSSTEVGVTYLNKNQIDGDIRNQLWTAPSERRVDSHELSLMMGKSRTWIYKHTSRATGYPILPHSKVDSRLQFTIGDIREWIKKQEAEGENSYYEDSIDPIRYLEN